MLYNPAWCDPAPLTLPKLIAWLERQPAEQPYDFFCNGGCLIGKYLRSCGYDKVWVGGWEWRPDGVKDHKGSQYMDWRIQEVAVNRPATYGAALSRARTALADTKMAEEPVS